MLDGRGHPAPLRVAERHRRCVRGDADEERKVGISQRGARGAQLEPDQVRPPVHPEHRLGRAARRHKSRDCAYGHPPVACALQQKPSETGGVEWRDSHGRVVAVVHDHQCHHRCVLAVSRERLHQLGERQVAPQLAPQLATLICDVPALDVGMVDEGDVCEPEPRPPLGM